MIKQRKLCKNKIIIAILFCLLFLSQTQAAFWNKDKDNTDLIISSKSFLTKKDLDLVDNESAVFKINQRIYFHIYSKKGFSSNFIKYQIVKQDNNAHIGGYSRIRNITKRIKNKNYDSEYFVLSETGKYIIQVFNIENLNHWIAYRAFLVVDE